MPITIMGDFADPLSFVASQRTTRLESLGLARVRWYAVQADPLHPMTGAPCGDAAVARIRDALLPGEVGIQARAVSSNSAAMTAAYAEAVADGCAAQLRGALFDAAWVAGLRMSEPDAVRRVVSAMMSRQFPDRRPAMTAEQRVAANRPLVPLGDADAIRITRRMGLTISMGGGPLTTAGHERLRSWRQAWIRHGRPQLPVIITELGELHTGEGSLGWLAARLPHAGAGDVQFSDADPTRTGRSRAGRGLAATPRAVGP